MSTSDWTDEQRERIQAFQSSGEASDLFGGDTRNVTQDRVDADTCREWRELVRTGEVRTASALSTMFTASTARAHAYGQCNHPEHVVGEPAEAADHGGALR
ncbi:hypothetical protein [Halococcus saccharolyticus]|uniref:Uncharacterized protein n=1 Tax=Halococcus saccharolyticus DSM 5350 TaxID=1227455 RepID=M0MT38_9EURY|nr:hypothetical protein [Halococcus saccharolyticus]EMA47625.1 hypothetical protein C449_01142 [Halococcus saccharolyticus DSM 5350]